MQTSQEKKKNLVILDQTRTKFCSYTLKIKADSLQRTLSETNDNLMAKLFSFGLLDNQELFQLTKT